MSLETNTHILEKVIKWISDEKKYNKNKKEQELIEEAEIKFDLSPKDSVFIEKLIRGDNK